MYGQGHNPSVCAIAQPAPFTQGSHLSCNRGEVPHLSLFLLPQQHAQIEAVLLCATSTSIFDTILQLLQIMPQKRQFVHFLKQILNSMVT